MFKKMKQKIYNNIVDHAEFAEGYPSESTVDFGEGNVSDLVYVIVSPVPSCLRRNMERDLHLRRQKEIVSVDGGDRWKREIYCDGCGFSDGTKLSSCGGGKGRNNRRRQ